MSINIFKKRREQMLATLKKLKEILSENLEMIPQISEIENEIANPKYGILWEEHEDPVERELQDKIPVLKEEKELKLKTQNNKPINYLIEGDNLHSLCLLEKTHSGKIDTIFIGPPYNIGNKDLPYNDDIVDTTDSYSHSKFLSFMDKRLKIAQKLLSDKGVIYIAITDYEGFHLKLLCDAIFGEENFVANLIWHNKESRLSTVNKFYNIGHEYVLCYAKDINKLEIEKVNNEKPMGLLENFTHAQAEEEIINLFGKLVFPFPENLQLVKWLLQRQSNANTVLDFFAGSGTTGHAVIELNKEDNGTRQFILCTNSENNICRDITYERIKRVRDKYKDEVAVNLKYYKAEYMDRSFSNNKDELSEYVKNLVELQNGIDEDETSVEIIFNAEELDKILEDETKIRKCKVLYLDKNAIIDNNQIEQLKSRGITINYIPKYYSEDDEQETEQILSDEIIIEKDKKVSSRKSENLGREEI